MHDKTHGRLALRQEAQLMKAGTKVRGADAAQEMLAALTATLAECEPQLADDSAAGALARGKVFELAGLSAQAVESYKSALTLGDKDPAVTARLAIALIKAARPREALDVALGLAVDDPKLKLRALASSEQISSFTILGDAYAVNEQLDAAAKAYEAATKLNSSDTYAAGRLAHVSLALGNVERAVGLAKTVGQNPRFAEMASVLALGARDVALVPRTDPGAVASYVAVTVTGRPYSTRSGDVTAGLVDDDAGWCDAPD